MDIRMVRVEDIRPYAKNPRKNEEAVKYVKASIREFGFKVPMVLDSKNVIVCGHTRFMAAKELGMQEVPCVYADDLSPEQVKAFRLADNKTQEAAEWDFNLLDAELASICSLDMEAFGFKDDVVDKSVLDDFFIDSEPKEKQKEYVQCEHCGEWFEAEL